MVASGFLPGGQCVVGGFACLLQEFQSAAAPMIEHHQGKERVGKRGWSHHAMAVSIVSQWTDSTADLNFLTYDVLSGFIPTVDLLLVSLNPSGRYSAHMPLAERRNYRATSRENSPVVFTTGAK